MTFLNPLMLFGLLAAAIPIIIHLFNFRKPKRVDFSSVEFLKELQQNTIRRMRLKQWLLLLLRTLAIAAIILSFARPTLTGSFADSIGKQAASSIALIIDNSSSMDLRDAQGDYMAQAKALAKTVVDQMELGDELTVFTSAGGTPEDATPFSNQLLARDAIDQVASAGGGRRVSSLVDLAQKQLSESSRPNRQIFVISDLQASTFADSVQGLAQHDANLVLIPIGSEPPGNIAVESVQVKSRIIEMDQAVKVEVGIRNHGQSPASDVVVSAYLDEQRVAQANASLAANGFEVVELVLTPKKRGWLSGVIEIGGDIYESDNIRHFVMNVPERRKVLLVEGDGETGRYIKLALSEELTRGRVAFDIDNISENRLPATELSAYDALILVGPKSVSSGEVANLTSFVQNGGGLVIFPGETADKSGLNNLLSRLGGGQYTTSLSGQGSAIASLGRSDFEHPVFDGMFDTDNRSGIQIEDIEIYKLVQYQAGNGNEQNIVRLNSSQAFLQELKSESGLALVFTSMPDLTWSDLPVRGLFIPLVYRSLFYVSSGQQSEIADLSLGEGASLKLRNPDQNQIVIKSPNGDELIPDQRSLQGASLIQIPTGFDQAGIYDFQTGSTRLSRQALNERMEESNLTRLPPENAAELLQKMTNGDVNVLSNVNSTSELQSRLSEARIGVEVWNVLLLIALILLLLEMFVSVRWKGQSED